MSKKTKKHTAPATEKARKQAIAAIGARMEALDGAAPSGDGGLTAPPSPAAEGTPAQANGTQSDATTPAKGKKGGKKAKKASAKPAKAARPARQAKAKKESKAKASKVKKVSALDAAAQVLARAKEPMRCQDMINAMESRGLWKSPGGRTPAATLYSALIREIGAKGKESRFKKTDRGLFTAGPGLKD
jgi:hypothetical protein